MMTKCDQCGEQNPADIHTCTPLEDWGPGPHEVHSLPSQPAPAPLTDENIDRISYALTGFDGEGTQAMNIDDIRRIARAAARLTAAPVAQPVESVDYIPHGWPDGMKPRGITKGQP